MIEPGIIFQVGAVIAAGAVGAIAGARRGVALVHGQSEKEVQRLIEVQASRINLLERHRQELEAKVQALEEEVARLREELDLEKKITARITRRPPRTPKPQD